MQDSDFVKQFPTYEAWKEQVNLEVTKLCGLGCDDLPDWDYRSAWQSGEDPRVTAKDVLENEMEY